MWICCMYYMLTTRYVLSLIIDWLILVLGQRIYTTIIESVDSISRDGPDIINFELLLL